MKSLALGVAGISLLVTLTSCGAGGAAKAVKADQPTAASAMGGKCTSPTEDAEPWVIDLKADVRGSLKAAMDKGVVVVAYDCKELKLLRSCQVRGNYEYSGTGFNEDLIRLTDADSVRATLSGGGEDEAAGRRRHETADEEVTQAELERTRTCCDPDVVTVQHARRAPTRYAAGAG